MRKEDSRQRRSVRRGNLNPFCFPRELCASAVKFLGVVSVILVVAGLIAAETQKPNVVLISIDTLRADALGLYGNKQISTPNIDALGKSGMVFKNHISHIPMTLPSHISMLTGLLPIHHGVHDNHLGRLGKDKVSIATMFSRSGYRTQAFISSIILDHHFGLDQGFDNYDDNVQYAAEEAGVMVEYERNGEQTAGLVVKWISSNLKAPFFLFIHMYDPHTKYDPPEPYAEKYKNKYFGEVAYVDEQVGKILRALEPVRKQTIVILTADHGEGLGDHQELTHGLLIYDSTLHVPFIISSPGLATGKVIGTQTRIIDITPTILEMAGLAPLNGIDGRSLLPLIRGESWTESDAFSESLYPLALGWHPQFSVRNSRWKYIDSAKPELFDLQKDPGETKNVVNEQPALSHQFSEKLKVFHEMLGYLKQQQQQVHDPELEEKLKSLGYLSGSTSNIPADFSKMPDPKDKVEIWSLYEQALFASYDGKAEEARQLIEKAIKLDPKVAMMYDMLARMSMRGEVRKAIEYLKEALKLEPENSSYHHRLAVCYRLTKQFQGAIDEDELALKLNPGSADTMIGLGTTYLEMGRAHDALLTFQKVLQIDPRNASATHQSATAFRTMGDLEHAQLFYEKAISLNPVLPDPYNGLGVIWAQRKDYEKAETYLNQALEKNPEFYEAYFNLGVTYQKQNRIQDAIRVFKIFIENEKNPKYGSRVEKAKVWVEENS